MTISPVLIIARGQFLTEWHDALSKMTDDEVRDFVADVSHRMTEIANAARTAIA